MFFFEFICEFMIFQWQYMNWRYEIICKPCLVPIHGFSWFHAGYHGFWPFFIREVIFKFMSEEYREEYRKMLRHNDMGVFKFCIQNSWNQVCLLKSCISIKSSIRTDNVPLNRRTLFLRLSSLCFLNCDLHLACVWDCVCWHNDAVNTD